MQNSYEFIGDLINNDKIYSKKLKDRVKVNGIFNEINISANNTLKKFIELSHSRYKNIKSGIPINNYLLHQKKEYEELSNKILDNNLYLSDDIENESQKLYKKVGQKECKEINKLRKNILVTSKNLSKNELILRQQYINKINKSKRKKEDEIDEKTKELQELENSIKKEKNFTVDEKLKYLTNLIDNDSKNFNDNVDSYRNFLKDIESKDSSKIIKIMNKNDNLGHKYNFMINNIKFLSFKTEKEVKIIKQKKEEKFDIKKLAQYTRQGNKKWFQKQIKEKSIKRMNSLKTNLNKNKNHGYFRNISQKNSSNCTMVDFNKTLKSSVNDINIINNADNNSNNNTLYNSSNYNGFNKTIFGNFRNTIKTVKSEAEFIKNIHKNFDIKRSTMNQFFKSNSLPKLKDYEKLSKQRTINDNSLSNENISQNEESDKNNIYEFNFVKKRNDNDSDYIMDEYKLTFYNKMKGWTRDEKIKKHKKRIDKISRENNRKFINELRNIKSKPNLFVDAYSLRDGMINEKIKLLNNSLNIPIYSKNMRLNIINDFNNYFQMKEKERRENEENMKKKQLEEEELIKGQDELYQLMQKMKNNLNAENKVNSEEEKINFKYKYSSIINKKNNENLNKKRIKEAFNEYLSTLNYIKSKNAKNKDENVDEKE